MDADGGLGDATDLRDLGESKSAEVVEDDRRPLRG